MEDNQPIEPDFAVHPGRLLVRVMERRGMKIGELALRLGIFPEIIEDIIRGKCLIDSNLIPKLSEVFGVPSSFWSNAVELYEARKKNISIPQPVDRINAFYRLENGWIEGGGVAFDKEGLDWLKRFFEERWPRQLPIPYIYPMANGDISLEWDIDRLTEVEIEVNLETHIGKGSKSWNHQLIVSTDEDYDEEEFELDFDAPETVDELLRILSPED